MSYPVGVIFLFSGGEFALSKDIPELDFLFSTSREDLSVIGWESNREDFRLVTNESLVGGTCSKIPKSECLIPWRGDGEAVLLRESQVGDEVIVSSQRLVGDTKVTILLFLEKFPDHDGFISWTGDKNTWVLVLLLGETRYDWGNPIWMSLEDTSLYDLDVGVDVISHFAYLFNFSKIFFPVD